MSSKNFTKKELANKIYRDLGFSKNFSNNSKFSIFLGFWSVPYQVLEGGEIVYTSKFGT